MGGEGLSTGDEGVIMQRKRGGSFRRESSHHHSKKMTFERIEVCFQGSVRVFMEVSSFIAWVNSIPGPSHVIGIQGVGGKAWTQQSGAGQLRDIRASHRGGTRALEAAPHPVFAKTMWTSSGGGGGSEKNGGKRERRKRF